nr:hypothetical protein BgiMline_007298 [Biomphalaria glabrata]
MVQCRCHNNRVAERRKSCINNGMLTSFIPLHAVLCALPRPVKHDTFHHGAMELNFSRDDQGNVATLGQNLLPDKSKYRTHDMPEHNDTWWSWSDRGLQG